LFLEMLDRRKGSFDPGAVGDLAVHDGDVEVYTHENPFARQIEIFDGIDVTHGWSLVN
jgi:hypothetical protein